MDLLASVDVNAERPVCSTTALVMALVLLHGLVIEGETVNNVTPPTPLRIRMWGEES